MPATAPITIAISAPPVREWLWLVGVLSMVWVGGLWLKGVVGKGDVCWGSLYGVVGSMMDNGVWTVQWF